MAKKKAQPKAPQASTTSSKKKVKAVPIDGLGSVELQKYRNAIRKVWMYSKARQLVVKRCTGEDGFLYCEGCSAKTPKLQVDHNVPIGDMLEPGFIERLGVSSYEMTGLCKTCHAPKTKKDNAETKAKKKSKKTLTLLNIEEMVPKEHLDAIEKVVGPIMDRMGRIPGPDDTKAVCMKFDEDILEMDLYSYEKVKLQEDRNANKAAMIPTMTLDMFL